MTTNVEEEKLDRPPLENMSSGQLDEFLQEHFDNSLGYGQGWRISPDGKDFNPFEEALVRAVVNGGGGGPPDDPYYIRIENPEEGIRRRVSYRKFILALLILAGTVTAIKKIGDNIKDMKDEEEKDKAEKNNDSNNIEDKSNNMTPEEQLQKVVQEYNNKLKQYKDLEATGADGNTLFPVWKELDGILW
jgi:hypothetical protein